jgi:hypothetical protein
MNTTTHNTENQFEALTEGQLKAIALMQFNGESYFVIGENVYIGDEDEAAGKYAAVKEDYESLDDFCSNEYDTVDEIDGSDDKDGYIVLTDDEANEMASNYIRETLWAFNADFIIDHSNLPYTAIDMIKNYQSMECEGANDTIEALIVDMDEFIDDAIRTDGRGHFMSSYDGRENEETVNGITYYIYRIN